jgi:L-arabonate dehydrase
VPLTLEDWDKYGHDVRTILDLQPSGRFLMEDFYYAGGLPAVLSALAEHGQLDGEALTVNGRTMGENVKDAPVWNSEVIRDYEKPLVESGGMAVLRGNLCPDGAVLKPSAASPHLMKHRGRAVVFESIEHYKERIDSRSWRSMRQRDGAEVLRAEGLSGDGGGGQHGVAGQAAGAGITDKAPNDAVWFRQTIRCRRR